MVRDRTTSARLDLFKTNRLSVPINVSKLSDRDLASAHGADKSRFKLGHAALEKDRINQLY